MTHSEVSMTSGPYPTTPLPFHRGWHGTGVARTAAARDARAGWRDQVGLRVDEILRLPRLSGADVVGGVASSPVLAAWSALLAA